MTSARLIVRVPFSAPVSKVSFTEGFAKCIQTALCPAALETVPVNVALLPGVNARVSLNAPETEAAALVVSEKVPSRFGPLKYPTPPLVVAVNSPPLNESWATPVTVPAAEPEAMTSSAHAKVVVIINAVVTVKRVFVPCALPDSTQSELNHVSTKARTG